MGCVALESRIMGAHEVCSSVKMLEGLLSTPQGLCVFFLFCETEVTQFKSYN